MKVIVVAGGTGGHIYPAVAIINKLKEKEDNLDLLYIGTTDRMEKDIIPKLGIKYIGIEMSGLNRHNLFSNFKVFKKFFKAISKSKEIIKEFKPDIVIGVGGYITAPVLYAAHKLGVKVLLHEQNSIPGLSNKFLSKYADTICVSLPGSISLFPKEKVVYTGNPRSEEIKDCKVFDKCNLGFSKDKKLVVIVMGSLGSNSITTKIKEFIPLFNDKDYEVLLITGKNYLDSFKEVDVPSNVKLLPFLDNLINLLKDTSLIVSRAGASTISEITAIGLPAILVPSPYVTHNHQYLNALELKESGACSIILEEDFNGTNLLKEIDNLLDNQEVYKNMQECSLKLGITDSATKIYNEIKKLVG